MNLDALRHSASHVMADAVTKIFPNAKLGIGPAIENGFYYDFDLKNPLSDKDLAKIEKQMQAIIKKDFKFERKEISKKEAKKLFKRQPYKLELINEIEGDKVSIYTHGKFVDLCKGPHIESTGQIKVFKLLSVAGSYWRGNENNPSLQRIYGTAFETKEELDNFLNLQEEAKKRDHRKLGPQLGFFSMHEEVGQGLVLYHPKGAMLRNILEEYEKKEHLKRGYQLVFGPHILKSDIWVRSGHYSYYKQNMFTFKIENKEYAVKPMNCPGHILIYKSKKRSYRELPIRYFELGSVYRNEKSGVLHGLLRVRGFTQDDAHIFCLPEQLIDEISGVIDFVIYTMKAFGFNDWKAELSTRPPKFIGSEQDWQRAEETLKQALEKKGMPFDINQGEGAFYGPKIDIKLKDALGRQWQCATIQCDFALPQRFDLKYTDKDGKEKPPVMLHRVLLGSIERFIGALLEHYGGNLPLWLSPVQVVIIPIALQHRDYADRLKNMLIEKDIRVSIDTKNETLNARIRDAQIEKIPYMLIVGDKEMQNQTVSVRLRSGEQFTLKIDEFIGRILEEVKGHN